MISNSILMASKNRPNFTIKTQTSPSLKQKWAIGVGLVSSLTLAALLLSLYEPSPMNLSVQKTAIVKISPIDNDKSTTKAEAAARKKIAKTVRLQSSLAYDKSPEALAQKQEVEKELALLKALEDVKLKRELHADDPNFDQAIWTEKQKSIEAKLTSSSH